MAFRQDQVISHYRLVKIIGEGGMGVVWKALDTKLNRHVALKFLPEEMTADPTRIARFGQEVKILASLSHPNIVTMHSVEEENGCKFFTMELVDGRTLSDIIPRNGMRLRNFFAFALPLVDAVAAAHEQNVTHRDLKPANVMITPQGYLKILDFGLAKLVAPKTPLALGTHVTTLTGEGTLLGTVTYMSPEQVEGHAIDHRSDIFSLGTVLYEMATGEAPFKGGSVVSMASSILRDEPRPLQVARPVLPRQLGRIISLCLAKDPERRYQLARDLRIQLEQLKDELGSGEMEVGAVSGPTGARRYRSWWMALWIPALLAAVLSGGFWLGNRRMATETRVLRQADMTLVPFAADGQWTAYPSWDPDSRWVVFSSYVDGSMDLFKKSVDGGNPVRLTRTQANETWPAWSPDGKTIAFSSDEKGGGIYVIGAEGGTPWRLIEAGTNPSWSPDGTQIAYDSAGSLHVTSLLAGEPRLIAGGTSDSAYAVWPTNGKNLIFWHRTRGDIAVVSLAGGAPETIGLVPAGMEINGLSLARDGSKLFFSQGPFGGAKDIWSVEIDPETAKPLAEPTRLTVSKTDDAHCSVSPDGRAIVFTAATLERNLWSFALDSATGLIVGDGQQQTFIGQQNHTPAFSPDGTMLVWTSHQAGRGLLYYRHLDEGGEEEKLTEEWHRDSREVGASFSPDGQQVAFASTVGGSYQVWRKPCLDCVELRLTKTRNPVRDTLTTWSPDGTEIAFYSNRSGSFDIWSLNLDAGGEPQRLTDLDSNEMYAVWSPDGMSIAFRSDEGPSGDIWLMGPDGSDPRPYVATPADEVWSAWSPDGSRFYFTSSLGGAFNVWLKTDQRSEPVQVTDYDGMLFGLPDTGRMTKFAVSHDRLVLPLEKREGGVYLLEIAD